MYAAHLLPHAVEFVRQARGEQMQRYLSSIGALTIEERTVASLSHLLQRIDEHATQGEVSAAPTSPEASMSSNDEDRRRPTGEGLRL